MSNDVRQRKIVTMRLGTITDLARQAQEYQAFMLKEYAEALWRRRRPDSNFAGYIPFGQYTWFQHPFQKGPDGLKPKMIWDTFREVLGPVHVQLECFDRPSSPGTDIGDPAEIATFEPGKTTFLVGAHSLGRLTESARETVHEWMVQSRSKSLRATLAPGARGEAGCLTEAVVALRPRVRLTPFRPYDSIQIRTKDTNLHT